MKKIITQITLILSFITFGFHSQAQITTTSVSNPSICDGTATLNASMISDTTWIWQQDSATVIQYDGLSIANLCAGNYFLTYIDSTGGTVYIDFTIGTTFSAPLYGYVVPTGVSADGLCNGIASAISYGGVPPYSFLFSDGTHMSNAYSLCAGLQSVTIADAVGDSISIDFIISTPSSISTTTSFGDSVLVDSVYTSAITDCVIDYLIVDSAYIIDYTILPGDTLLVTWGVVYGDTIVTIVDSYVLGTGAAAGVYMVVLQVYCPTKTVGHFLTASDQIYYNAAFAGIKENNTKATNLSIYPNPFNEELTISLDQDQKSEVTIADITGKTIVNQNFNTQIIKLDLSRMSSGQYIVSIKNDNSISTRKIIKQ